MSVFHWGEDPKGQWILEIIGSGVPSHISLERWDLLLYGTKKRPYSNSTCHTECMSGCSGPGADQCYGCLHFKIPGAGNKYTCVATCPDNLFPLFTKNGRNASCSSACNDGWYPGSRENNGRLRCKECPHGCIQCRSPNLCLKCGVGWNTLIYGRSPMKGKACVRHCWKHYYLDEKARRCLPCSQACSACDGPERTDCLRCHYPKIVYKRQCHDSCPKKLYQLRQHCVTNCSDVEGYYSDKTRMTCEPCSPLCVSCYGNRYDACTKCRPRYYRLNGRCRLICPRGYYRKKTVSGEKVCVSCGRSCTQKCGDHGALCPSRSITYEQVIAECPSGTFHEFNKKHRASTCVERCTTGYYGNTVTQRCTICNRRCTKCRSQMKCTSCRSPYFLYDTNCISDCPPGHFRAQGNGSRHCLPCGPNCNSCIDRRYCFSCAQPFILVSGHCQDRCPSGFHLRRTVTVGVSQCQACHHRCQECHSPGFYNCTRCSNHFYLYESRCSQNCPIGYYKNDSNLTCDPCHSSCRSCFGPSLTDCTACKNRRTPISHQCLQSCPSHLYLQSLSQTSHPIAICVRRCKQGTYGNEQSGICTPCHPLCTACFAQGLSNCTACKSYALLDGNTCMTNRVTIPYSDTTDNKIAILEEPFSGKADQTSPTSSVQQVIQSTHKDLLPIAIALSSPSVLLLLVSVVLAFLLFQARQKLAKQAMSTSVRYSAE